MFLHPESAQTEKRKYMLYRDFSFHLGLFYHSAHPATQTAVYRLCTAVALPSRFRLLPHQPAGTRSLRNAKLCGTRHQRAEFMMGCTNPAWFGTCPLVTNIIFSEELVMR